MVSTYAVPKHVFIACLVVGLAVGGAQVTAGAKPAGDDPSITSSVVKLYVYSDPPDLTVPWQTQGAAPYGGSGVIIEGKRILTNAHVVEDAVSIEVKRADGSELFPAAVTFISHDADLALVEVEDGQFFKGARALPIGEMPKLQQEVQVWGFPEGGETLSITSGIVSRIEVDAYAQSRRMLLSAQIDAAINEGNSGGPVLSDGTVVGIAMQTLADAENVGYMVPAPVVRHFIEDVADGRYDGFPRLGIQVQDMESRAQRLAAGMKSAQTGALVIRVDYGGPCWGVLRPRDVLLEIDGRKIANDLTVSWPGIGHVHFALAYQDKQIGDSVKLRILRGGKTFRKTIRLRPHTKLVPGRRTTDKPRFLVFGGLVFQPLSEEFLDEDDLVYFDSVAYADLKNVVTKDRREIILLQQVLPHPVNRGYQDWGGEIVRMVNGVVPRDMDHLASMIDGAEGRWLRIVTEDGGIITLDANGARGANKEILYFYGIPRDRYLGNEPEKPQRRRRRRR